MMEAFSSRGDQRMIRQIIVTIPIPPRGTRANASHGGHWGPKARATKKQRQDAGYAALEVIRHRRDLVFFVKATVLPKFFFKDKRAYDASNLGTWLKASLDGLADAGIVANDRDFTLLPAEMLVDPLYQRVDLVITEIAKRKLEAHE